MRKHCIYACMQMEAAKKEVEDWYSDFISRTGNEPNDDDLAEKADEYNTYNDAIKNTNAKWLQVWYGMVFLEASLFCHLLSDQSVMNW